MLARLGHLWNKLWFEPLPAQPLAAFRIAFGCYLLAYFLEYLPYVDLSFSNVGVYSPVLIPDVAPPPAVAYAIYAGTLVVIASFIVGFQTRISSVLMFALFEYHHFLNFFVSNATYDRINDILLFLLCFVDSGAAWSIDARRRGAARLVPAWHIRLFQFQLAAIYFGTGMWKALNPDWYGGDMIKYSVACAWSSPLAFHLLRADWPNWVFTALAWTVVLFELVAGFTLFFKRTRTPTMIVGLTFHLFNAVVLLIPAFLNCVTMYPLFMEFKRTPRDAAGDQSTDRVASEAQRAQGQAARA